MLTLATAYILGTLGIARATRLLVHDDWPPIRGLRLAWIQWHDTRDYNNAQSGDPAHRHGWRYGWASLVTCPFCMAPYPTALALAVTIATGVWTPGWSWAGAWWVLAVWASVSYLAAMIVVRDEPDLED